MPEKIRPLPAEQIQSFRNKNFREISGEIALNLFGDDIPPEDITGITNENEFYTHHYLSAILENDLKDVFKEWKCKEDEEGVPQPYKGLRGLRKEFFAKQSLLERERNIEERLSLQRDFVAQLLSVLGFDYHNQTVELDPHGSIPQRIFFIGKQHQIVHVANIALDP